MVTTQQSGSPQRLVVIGNGMVGHRFVESIADDRRFSIVVISEEPRLAYDRVHLSDYFNESTAQDLALASPQQYATWGVATHIATKTTRIDRTRKCVVTGVGTEISYDLLVLATGSYPFVPPIPGKDRAHCHVYRTIEDLDAMQASGRGAEVGTVVGGGLLGLEAANALQNMGLRTHVAEFAASLMNMQVNEDGGK